MGAVSHFEGWQTYPENLELWDGSDYGGLDCHSYREQLTNDAKRLFVTDAKLVLKIFEIGVREHNVQSLGELEDYLQTSKSCNVTRLILIPQEYSWGRLVISYEAVCKLFTWFSVYPGFIDVLRTFGEKTNFEDDSFTGYRLEPRETGCFEISYLVKHAEEHGRSEQENAWSIRQMGIYHQMNARSGDIFIILNPSKTFQHRLKRMQQRKRPAASWDLHMMLLACSMEKWRWCVTEAERRYVSMVCSDISDFNREEGAKALQKTKAQLSNVVGIEEKPSSLGDIHFDDTQDIQVHQDYCIQLCQFIVMNRSVLEEMQRFTRYFFPTEDRSEQPKTMQIVCLLTNANEQLRRMKTLLKRLDGTMGLVRAILDFRCLESLQCNSINMTEMARLSREENALIVGLTQKNSRDTDIVKTLTLLTLVYLPASFVSSMMGMDYIRVDSRRNHVSIHFLGEFWIFLVLTVLLLIFTLGSYFWWLRSRKAKDARVTHQQNGSA